MNPLDTLPLKAAAESLDLLESVRVLDLTTSVAGPYAGQLLADMGAAVVKIERPHTGDDARAWGPPFLDGDSLWFLAVNRNKFSLAVDYTSEEGCAVLHRLVAVADVVLVNQVERVQKKLGIDHASLSELRAGLIHVSVTGFGLSGARRNLPCYDLIAEGYSSVMDLTGEPDTPPQKVGTPAADLLAGQDAAMAVAAALVRRSRTGQGCMIDVALVDTMTRFMAPRILPYLGSGELPKRSGGRDSVIAIYQAFETADECITLGLGNDRIWTRFWAAVGEPGAGADERFASNAARRQHRPELVERIQVILRQRPREQWLALFAQAGVPAGPIYRVDEVARDRLLQERGLFYRVQTQSGAYIPQVGLGIRFDGRSEACVRTPPRLGGDSDALLRDWLGAETVK